MRKGKNYFYLFTFFQFIFNNFHFRMKSTFDNLVFLPNLKLFYTKILRIYTTYSRIYISLILVYM